MSANYLNDKSRFDISLRRLQATMRAYYTRSILLNGTFLFNAVSLLEREFNMYIDIRHEYYPDGVNILVQVLCVVDGEYVNELCSGVFGDNGEISDIRKAYEVGLDSAIELLKKYKINNKIWK